MSAVVCDTHTLIWYSSGSSQLSLSSLKALEETEKSGQPIYIPSIVIIEMCYLVEKKTITQSDYEKILSEIRDPSTALTVSELSFEIAEAVTRIPRETVPDMPDRIIAATALSLGIPLVTRDKKIRALSNIVTIW